MKFIAGQSVGSGDVKQPAGEGAGSLFFGASGPICPHQHWHRLPPRWSLVQGPSVTQQNKVQDLGRAPLLEARSMHASAHRFKASTG